MSVTVHPCCIIDRETYTTHSGLVDVWTKNWLCNYSLCNALIRSSKKKHSFFYTFFSFHSRMHNVPMIILPLSIYFVIFLIARTKCLFPRGGYVKYNSCTFYTVQWLFHARLVSIESRSVRSFFLPRIVCVHIVPRIIITRFYPLSRIDSSSSLCYELEHPALQRNFWIRILI